ncbi:hypothetical protein I4F81_003342 [Pyropia yezoensis]|uniref:Uncharacterized protein n=1 Tax=Pyropia yezoensis TaxID=2788 RepID=A0ACC3BSS6_PYRYE|nr:hypothetical protein I4F81_003342 [Neopyropia yezoensis]
MHATAFAVGPSSPFLRLARPGAAAAAATSRVDAARRRHRAGVPRPRQRAMASATPAEGDAPAASPPPLPSPLRWGIIGPGDVCVHKSGPAFARATGSAIGAVSKRSPGAAAAFASRLPGGGEGVAAYTGSAGLLADPAVAAVYVATPPGAHANLTAAAAAAGMAVYVEKPMARCGAEAAAMLTAVGGGRLAVAYYRRALAKYAWRVDEVVLTGTAGVARLSVLGVDGPVEVTQPLIQAVVDDWTGVPGAPPQPSPAAAAVRTSELVDEVLVGVYGERRMGFWEGWAKPGGARS